MKINKTLIIITILIGLAYLTIGNNITIARTKSDLITINEILQKQENVTINEWSLHARERLENVTSIEDAKAYQSELKTVFPNGDWVETKNHQSWQAKMVLKSSGQTEESIILTTSLTTDNVQSYIMYEVRGKKLADKEMKRLDMEINKKISDIFRGKPTIFSCIKGEFSDKMNETLPYKVNHLLDAFQAKKVEALEEDDFISTSAYTPLFEERIDNSEKEMNVQIGLRTQDMGGKTTFVVGTPIITIEY
ncbi:YwmB family TATA-box binding protein [Niallia circulans]|uniref:YwmB family TATA-box binding protein n=1 Tax=Niallia circulans TaxID=1397 RepID=UPI003D951541